MSFITGHGYLARIPQGQGQWTNATKKLLSLVHLYTRNEAFSCFTFWFISLYITVQPADLASLYMYCILQSRKNSNNDFKFKLEALKSLCHSPWSMCKRQIKQRTQIIDENRIHDKIVFWWWWCVCQSHFTEHSCCLQFSLSIMNLEVSKENIL